MEQNELDITGDNALSLLLIALLKGVVYQESDPHLWGTLLRLQVQTRDYFRVINLDLHLDEAEGYAFLRSSADSEEDESAPRLISRRPLSFPVSLLLALLRKKMAEFDASGSETRLILTQDQIVDTIRVFMTESTNEVRIIDQIGRHINKVTEMGFLRPLRNQNQTWEVRRILKAFIDAQWLSEFDARLQAYYQHMTGEEHD